MLFLLFGTRSPYLILPVKTRIILKSLNEASLRLRPVLFVAFKFQVQALFIYSKQFKLLLGWLSNSEKLIVASQTVHGII